MNSLDELLQKAQFDHVAMEQLIQDSETFILKCTSSATGRYITKSDDEWSIALLAFTEAVRDYQPQRGKFLSFAQLVIQRRLIDAFKKQTRRPVEILADPLVFASGSLEQSPQPALQLAVSKKLITTDENELRMEIEAANQAFYVFGFSFFDLAKCSPKSQKTKKACSQAVACLLKNKILYDKLYSSKQLPIKNIEEITNVPRKILDRHRKYIIAATVILSGEYPYLAEYMRFIRKELDK